MSPTPIPERPDPKALMVFFLQSLLLGPFFLIVMIPQYFRYTTTRYQVEGESISMRWGILSQTEVNLAFKRIQDIHLRRGFLERFFGIASLSIQTASGNIGAEMTLYGIRNYTEVRDFLYSKMRGAEHDAHVEPRENRTSEVMMQSGATSVNPHTLEEIETLLREINDNLRAVKGME